MDKQMYDASCLSTVMLRNKFITFLRVDDCIGNTLAKGKYWEEWMLKYIKMYYVPHTNVLDLGANIGTSALLMSEVVSDDGKVMCFEPIYHDILEKNIHDNNLAHKISILRYATGSHPHTIHIPKVNPKHTQNFGALSLVEKATTQNTHADATPVQVVPVDQFAFKNVSLIKIDVENMEIETLEGCMDLIKTCRPTILIESHDTNKLTRSDTFHKLLLLEYDLFPIYEGRHDYVLRKRNFKPSNFEHVIAQYTNKNMS